MTLQYRPKNNPRVIVIQKLYGKYFNEDENLTFPKHRFKKFIKDVVNGTVERDDVINEEIKKHLNEDLIMKNLDKVFQIIVKSAIFEFLYKPKTSSKIIINEYLRASNFFIEDDLAYSGIRCSRRRLKMMLQKRHLSGVQHSSVDAIFG